MQVVIQVAAEDGARAWGVLVRHSVGTALPHRTFIVSEDAARALREAGISFKELSRGGMAGGAKGVPAGDRI